MSRKTWVDSVRGQAIILVVLAHVWRGLRDAHVLKWNSLLQFSDSAVYSFHMPVFFLLAGITAYISDERAVGRFSPLLRLYAVYLFWSVFQTSIMLALSHFTSGTTNIWDIVLIPIKANAQFWFLLVLIIFRLIAAIIPNPLIIPIAILMYICGSLFDQSEYLPFQVSHFFIFFVAGYRSWDRVETAFNLPRPLAWAFLSFVGLLVTCCVMQAKGMRYDSIVALPAVFFGFLLLYYLSESFDRVRVDAWMVYLGRYSLHIYILHIMVASGIRIASTRLYPSLDPYFLLCACTVAGLGLPIMAAILAKSVGLDPIFTMRWRKTRNAA
jgi:fucose 4-O-acetylase-like acetyltransferase